MEYDAFAAALERSFRPRLVVLNLCGSSAVSGRLGELVPSAITWPATVDDDQSRVFAGQLYQALATGRTLGHAHGDACTALERWPRLAHPTLAGGNHAATLF